MKQYEPGSRPRIALVYFVVASDNAIGSIDRQVIEQLCEKYDFTVFAIKFDNPRPDRIRWVRVRSLARPAIAVAICFRIAARIAFVLCNLKGDRFDILQASDAVLGNVDIADAHFCNRFYLRNLFNRSDLGTLRAFLVFLARLVMSLFERWTYRRALSVVTPSAGLRRELISAHGIGSEKIVVIPHPADRNLSPPAPDDRAKARERLGLKDEDTALVFIALGDFERKGLGPLIDALADARLRGTKLLVVGGNAGSVSPYRDRAINLGIGDRVIFCGRHPNVQPFLWASDAFVFPSRYETFSIVTMQAAVSGLPLITTRLSGVEEYVSDGLTGFTIPDCRSGAIADSIARFLALNEAQRRGMGNNARLAITTDRYSIVRFVEAWDALYSMVLRAKGHSFTSEPRAGAGAAPAHRI